LRNVVSTVFNSDSRHAEIAVPGRPYRLQRAAARRSQIVRLAARLCVVAHREKVPVTRRAGRLRVRPEVRRQAYTRVTRNSNGRTFLFVKWPENTRSENPL